MTYDRTGWAVKFVGEIRLEGRQEEELEFRKYHRKMDYYYYYYIFSSLNLNMYIYIYIDGRMEFIDRGKRRRN